MTGLHHAITGIAAGVVVIAVWTAALWLVVKIVKSAWRH